MPAACCASSGRGMRSPGIWRQELRCVVAGGDKSRLGRSRWRHWAAPRRSCRGQRPPSSIDRAKAASGVLSAGAVASPRSFSENRKSNAIAAAPARFNASTSARKALMRPRPLPEPLERFVVDRDDADGLVEGVRARLPALVLVEDQILHHGPRRRADDASEQRQPASGRRGQCVKSGLVRPSHVALVAREATKIEDTPLLSSG